MDSRYTCTNINCSHPGHSQYEIRFKSEYIMDNNNVAATFCPFCKKEMLRVSMVKISQNDPHNTTCAAH